MLFPNILTRSIYKVFLLTQWYNVGSTYDVVSKSHQKLLKTHFLWPKNCVLHSEVPPGTNTVFVAEPHFSCLYIFCSLKKSPNMANLQSSEKYLQSMKFIVIARGSLLQSSRSKLIVAIVQESVMCAWALFWSCFPFQGEGTTPKKLYTIIRVNNISNNKGVFNLSSQLSNFSKDWGMQRGIIEFCRFHGLISSHFCYSRSKIAMIPTIFTGKHVKFLEISLETMTWGN